jgi:hypothetical protein
LAGFPGLPGEDGAPGQKVFHLLPSLRHRRLILYLFECDHWIHMLCLCVCLCLSIQGEPGVGGLRGPEGAAGIGTQGEKVRRFPGFSPHIAASRF